MADDRHAQCPDRTSALPGRLHRGPTTSDSVLCAAEPRVFPGGSDLCDPRQLEYSYAPGRLDRLGRLPPDSTGLVAHLRPPADPYREAVALGAPRHPENASLGRGVAPGQTTRACFLGSVCAWVCRAAPLRGLEGEGETGHRNRYFVIA